METGMLGEFATTDDMLRAIYELRSLGYRKLDAFTPHPVKGLGEALGLERSKLPWMVFPFGLLGAALGYTIQWFCNAVDYPLNVGGRPLHSAPAFIPVAFEMGVLFTAVFGVLLAFSVTRLPRLYVPLYEAEGFERATLDAFLVGIDELDPLFSPARAELDLRSLGAIRVMQAERRRAS